MTTSLPIAPENLREAARELFELAAEYEQRHGAFGAEPRYPPPPGVPLNVEAAALSKDKLKAHDEELAAIVRSIKALASRAVRTSSRNMRENHSSPAWRGSTRLMTTSFSKPSRPGLARQKHLGHAAGAQPPPQCVFSRKHGRCWRLNHGRYGRPPAPTASWHRRHPWAVLGVHTVWATLGRRVLTPTGFLHVFLPNAAPARCRSPQLLQLTRWGSYPSKGHQGWATMWENAVVASASSLTNNAQAVSGAISIFSRVNTRRNDWCSSAMSVRWGGTARGGANTPSNT